MAGRVQKLKKANPANTTGATVGYEAELWQMADALRGSMDAAEYKHVVLGLWVIHGKQAATLTNRFSGSAAPAAEHWRSTLMGDMECTR